MLILSFSICVCLCLCLRLALKQLCECQAISRKLNTNFVWYYLHNMRNRERYLRLFFFFGLDFRYLNSHFSTNFRCCFASSPIRFFLLFLFDYRLFYIFHFISIARNGKWNDRCKWNVILILLLFFGGSVVVAVYNKKRASNWNRYICFADTNNLSPFAIKI